MCNLAGIIQIAGKHFGHEILKMQPLGSSSTKAICVVLLSMSMSNGAPFHLPVSKKHAKLKSQQGRLFDRDSFISLTDPKHF
jgi:hypothetical protein